MIHQEGISHRDAAHPDVPHGGGQAAALHLAPQVRVGGHGGRLLRPPVLVCLAHAAGRLLRLLPERLSAGELRQEQLLLALAALQQASAQPAGAPFQLERGAAALRLPQLSGGRRQRLHPAHEGRQGRCRPLALPPVNAQPGGRLAQAEENPLQ